MRVSHGTLTQRGDRCSQAAGGGGVGRGCSVPWGPAVLRAFPGFLLRAREPLCHEEAEGPVSTQSSSLTLQPLSGINIASCELFTVPAHLCL